MAKSKRPGVMLYFEIKHVLNRLDLEQCGLLLHAIIEYGETGYVPNPLRNSDDLALLVAWDAIKPKIDADELAYKDKCEKARQAALSRREK